MRFIGSAGAALALAGVATLTGAAVPALATGPQIDAYPSVVAPGHSVAVSITCISGKHVGTSATFYGVTLGLPARIPMGPATHKGVFVTSVELPRSTMPGVYRPSVDCSNGLSGVATMTVRSAVVRPVVVTPVVVPSGAPVTGDGVTSTAVGGSLTAAGLGVLGLSALVGAFAVWRRKDRR